MAKIHVVALIGPEGVGKTTTCELMKVYSEVCGASQLSMCISFADALREEVILSACDIKHNNLLRVYADSLKDQKVKKVFRQTLLEVGAARRRQAQFHWVNIMDRKLRGLYELSEKAGFSEEDNIYIFCDDMRYLNEYRLFADLKKAGDIYSFEVIRLVPATGDPESWGKREYEYPQIYSAAVGEGRLGWSSNTQGQSCYEFAKGCFDYHILGESRDE